MVRACVHSFEKHHPSWELSFLDDESTVIESVPIPEEKWKKLKVAHRSDLIRTQLLFRHGGVWIDPTVFIVGSLDQWLSKYMDSGLFLFDRPGRDRLISNWFIAAEPGNVLLGKLYGRLCRYWSENDFDNLGRPESELAEFVARALNRNLFLPRLWLRKPLIKLLRTAPYMVYHYQFADLVARDRTCREIWRRTPKISADGPHRLLRYGLLNPLSAELRECIDDADPPLFKLTWKLGSDEIPPGSVLAYLFERSVQDHS